MSDILLTLTQPDDINVTLTDEGDIVVSLATSETIDLTLSQAQGEPGKGMPTGGTTGQFVVKKSNADFDFEFSAGASLDHGSLTGLGDDDHTQYHNDTRGDARYAPTAKGVTNGDSHDHSGGDGAQISYSGLSNIPSTFAPTTHATAHVTGGTDVIASAVAGGNAGLMTGSDKTKLDGIASGAEVNVQSDWNSVSGDSLILNKPTTMTPTTHATSHVTGGSDVIASAVAGGNAGLMTGADKTKLDGIASGAEVNVQSDWNAVAGDALILNKPSALAPTSHNTSHVTGGADVIANAIAGGNAGLMSGADKTKLDGITAGADVTTASNSASGTGEGLIFKSKSSSDLVFKKIKQGSNITITNGTDDITIAAASGGTNTNTRIFTFVLHRGENATTGTNKTNKLVVDKTYTINKAYAYATTAPTGAALIFDINLNGSTIWSTQANRLQIAAGANSGTQTSFNSTTLAENDILSIDIDQIGSTLPGADITVILRGDI